MLYTRDEIDIFHKHLNRQDPNIQCVIPENIHTHPKEGHWKFQEGVLKAKIFKGKYEAKLEFLEGWEGSNQKTFHEGVWIFSGTTQFAREVEENGKIL